MQKRQEVMTSILHGLKPHMSCYRSSITELKSSLKEERKKKKETFLVKR